MISLSSSSSAFVKAGVVLVAAFAAFPSYAQNPSPDSQSSTFQDWTVNCSYPPEPKPAAGQKPTDPKPPVKGPVMCEMVQQFLDRNSRQVIARLAIGRVTPSGEMKMALQVPEGIYLPPGFTVGLSETNNVKGVYSRCMSSMCTGEADVKKEFLDQAKTAEKLTLTFADGAGRTISLPVSPKGFGTALAALSSPKL